MTALVFLPAPTPPLTEDAHLTLVWAGDQAVASVVSQLTFQGQAFARQHKAFPARVLGTAMFGQNHDEPVLLIELTSQIALLRAVVAQYSQSEYTEFRPHIAVPSLSGRRFVDLRLRPEVVYFNRLAVWAGEEHGEGETVWWMGT